MRTSFTAKYKLIHKKYAYKMEMECRISESKDVLLYIQSYSFLLLNTISFYHVPESLIVLL